jgi:hypothetical protein
MNLTVKDAYIVALGAYGNRTQAETVTAIDTINYDGPAQLVFIAGPGNAYVVMKVRHSTSEAGAATGTAFVTVTGVTAATFNTSTHINLESYGRYLVADFTVDTAADCGIYLIAQKKNS